MKVVTIVTGKVPAATAEEFRRSYASLQAAQRPAGLETSFLLKSADDQESYVIQSIWTSQEALDAMRSAGKPKAIELFEQASASPKVAIYMVIQSIN